MIRRFFLDEEDEYYEIEEGQVAISPEERFFAETFGLGATIIWDIDGNVIHRLRKPILETDYAELSLFIEFSHEGNLLASVSFDRYSIDIWDVNSGDLIKTITHDYEIMYFSFIPQTNNLVFSDEYNYLYFIDLVKYSYNKELFLKELVYNGESQLVEFKKSIRWDYKQNSINKEFEFLLVKDISALLNTNGGFLLLGVSNEGEFIGLEKDYETLVKNDRYGFSIHLIQTINDYIGYQLKDFWSIEFFNIEEKEICLIRIDKSPKPVFIRRLYQQEEFYIRTGSTTVLLTGQKLLDHLKPKKQTEELFSQLQEFKELLSEFEVEMRNLVEKILSNEFDDWWEKCIQDQHKRRAIELLKREKRQDEIRGVYNRMYKEIDIVRDLTLLGIAQSLKIVNHSFTILPYAYEEYKNLCRCYSVTPHGKASF